MSQTLKVYRPKTKPIFILILLIFLVLFTYNIFLIKLNPSSLFSSLFNLFILLGGSLYIYLRLKFQYYELKDDGVFIRRGVIAKSRGTLLYSEIQDIQEYQDIFARIFGVISLRIKTMSLTPGNLVYLSKEDSDEIKGFILSKISKKKTSLTLKQKAPEEGSLAMPYPLHPFKSFAISIIFKLIALFIIYIFLSSLLNKGYLKSLWDIESAFIYIGIIIVLWQLINAIITNYGLKYYLTENFFEKRFYFIAKSYVRLPYLKIQDIVIKQGIIERLIGLSTILVETGEKALAEAEQQNPRLKANDVSYLNKNDALLLQYEILKLMGIKRIQTKVLRPNYPLDKIKPLKKALRATYYLILVLIILLAIVMPIATKINFAILSNVMSMAVITFIFVILFFILKLIYEIFYFKTYYYADNEELLVLRKGVFNIDTLTIPYSKIQHIFVDQDFFDKIFGLWDVHVASAGTSKMQLHIDGLKIQYAEALRNLLIQRTIYKNKK